MTFKLYESKDEDMVDTFEFFADTLSHIGYFWHLYPHNDTPEGRKIGAERMLAEKQEGHAKFLRVVDDSTGETAGCAIWLVFKNERLPEDFFELQGDFWDDAESREQAAYAMHEFSEFRKNAIKNANGNMLVLDVLAVAPKYRRQGIGRMLVKWGTSLADELGYKALVEASETARGLYESEGFRTHYRVYITWPQKWAHLKEVAFYWLTRPSAEERNNLIEAKVI